MRDHSHAEGAETGGAIEARTVRRWAGSWPGAGVLLIALSLAAFVPGLWAIPPIDRDESRFAQASRQMWESGDYVVPRIQDKPRLNKPPLVYWLQCASVGVFGDEPGRYAHGNIWVFRVPGVLCAVASVLLTWRLGLRMMDARAATLAAALLAVCPLVAWDAHQARADQLLLLTVMGAQYALWMCWRAARREGSAGGGRVPMGACIGLWVAIGLGIMAKGPVTPMIAALTCVALSLQTRGWRWMLALRPAMGAAIVSVIVAPWVVAVASRVGWEVYARTVLDETLGRSAGAKEGHWGPPGYHLVLLCVLFWPGVLMTGLGVRRAWKRRRAGGSAFLLAWIVPSWIVFELVTTKLPHYTMPLYPAVALLSGRAVMSAASGRLAGLGEWGTRIGFAVWGLVGVGILVAGLVLLSVLSGFEDVREAAMVTSLWYLLIGFVLVQTYRSVWKGRWAQAQLRSIIAATLMMALLFQTLAPAANRMSTRIVQALSGEHPAGAIGAVGYQEDSLIFLTRGRVERLGTEELRGWLAQRPGAALLLPPLETPVDMPEGRYTRGDSVTGLNYSRGRVEQVEIWRKLPE